MPLFLALLTIGCVPKKKFDAQLATAERLSTELDASKTAVEGLQADLGALQSALDNEREANQNLTALTASLEERGKAQEAQLATLSERIAEMGAVNSAQRAAKSDLEALVGELQSQTGDARAEAQEAVERASALAAERTRLEAERQALKEKAERLEAEKAKLEEQTAEYDALVNELQTEIEAGEITITELSGKLTVAMSNAILFDSGAVKVKAAGKQALGKVAGVLADVKDREIRVEGHTDNVPVGAGAAYPDNWALSALRASTVVALLEEGGVDPLNVAAVGYGEHHPTSDNDTREGRAANRRTEIVLVPKLR